MSKTFTCPFPQNINSVGTSFANADGTSLKTIFTAGSNDSLLKTLIAVSTDSSSRDIKLYLHDGTNSFPLGIVAVAANAGNANNSSPINLLGSLTYLIKDELGNPVLKVKTGWTVRASLGAAVTSGQTITILAVGEDY